MNDIELAESIAKTHKRLSDFEQNIQTKKYTRKDLGF